MAPSQLETSACLGRRGPLFRWDKYAAPFVLLSGCSHFELMPSEFPHKQRLTRNARSASERVRGVNESGDQDLEIKERDCVCALSPLMNATVLHRYQSNISHGGSRRKHFFKPDASCFILRRVFVLAGGVFFPSAQTTLPTFLNGFNVTLLLIRRQKVNFTWRGPSMLI